MNKTQLVEQVARQAGLSKKDANNVINVIIEKVRNALAKDEKVTLAGFGTFLVQERKSRIGVNPQTGEPIHIRAKEIPKFRPGSNLSSIVSVSSRRGSKKMEQRIEEIKKAISKLPEDKKEELFFELNPAWGKALQKWEKEALKNLREGKTVPLEKVENELQGRA